MKMWKRLICWAVCLMMVCALAVSVAPVKAEAAEHKVTIAGAKQGEEIVAAVPGVPVALDDNAVWIFTRKGLYNGDGYTYVVATAKGLVEMKYVSSDTSFDVFEISGDTSVGYKAAQAVIGSEITLYGLLDTETVTGKATITGYDPTPKSQGFYALELKLANDMTADFPVALVNSSGQLVAIYGKEGALAFAEPKSSGSTPQETQPKETHPKQTTPPETAPQETSPAPDGPARGTEPATETTPEETIAPKEGLSTGAIIGIAAGAVVVIAVVALLLVKKNKKPAAAVVDIGETLPEKPVEPKPGPGEWERASKPAGIAVYIVGMDGALRGHEYPISERGILIGRAEDANVRYPADTKGVSRRHCKVFWNNGVLMVMDLGSTSGTFLRGKGQLPPNAPVAIVEGDMIYLGSKQNAMAIRTK